ncbi:MAG: hypothetical protein V3V15_08245 [Sphingorhabdus sp.]
MKKLKRLFQIKTKTEVFIITYALAMGAVKRGQDYLAIYPGYLGDFFFLLTTGAVFLAAVKMLDAVEYHRNFGVD